MNCKQCGVTNPEDAKFCRSCGNELNVYIMDKYPEYYFVPTNLMEWQKPWFAKLRYLFLCFVIVGTILSSFYAAAIYSNPTVDIEEVNHKYRGKYRCYVEDPIGLFWAQEYNDDYYDARREAIDRYHSDVYPVWIICGIFFIISLFVLRRHGKYIYPKEDNQLMDIADYVQQYTYIGLTEHKKSPYLKFFVKDNKFGLLDVAHYCVYLPAAYDKLSWREKNRYLTAIVNGRTFIIDINGKELK